MLLVSRWHSEPVIRHNTVFLRYCLGEAIGDPNGAGTIADEIRALLTNALPVAIHSVQQ
jgi:hypothetical protein